MSPLSLLVVPACLGVMVALLIGVSWIEQHLLSPRSLMAYSARARHVGPDTVEMLIARQSEPLLRSQGLVPVPRQGPSGPAS